MVAADGDVTVNTAEDGIVSDDVTGCGNTVEYVAEVFQLSAEGFADGLMTEADTEYRLFACLFSDNVK